MVKDPCICQPTQTEQWFDNFIGQLRTDQLLLETSNANSQKQAFYTLLMSEDMNQISMLSRIASSEYFLKKLIIDYISEIDKFGHKPNKLSFYYTTSKLLVWAEINDNDEQMEKMLYRAEAVVNAQYHKYGFHVSSTILEKCDNFDIPSQYKPFLTN